MQRRKFLMSTAIGGIAALGGCLSSDNGEGDEEEGETVDVEENDEGEFVFPPGVSEDEVDPEVLAEAHFTEFVNVDNVLNFNIDAGYDPVDREITVRAFGDVIYIEDPIPEQDYTLRTWVDGDRGYEHYDIEGEERTPYVMGRLPEREHLVERRFIEEFLEFGRVDLEYVGHGELSNGDSVAVLEAAEQSFDFNARGMSGAEEFTATVYVDPEGLIRQYEADFVEVESDDIDEVSVTYRVSIDDVAVDEPDWVSVAEEEGKEFEIEEREGYHSLTFVQGEAPGETLGGVTGPLGQEEFSVDDLTVGDTLYISVKNNEYEVAYNQEPEGGSAPEDYRLEVFTPETMLYVVEF